MKSTKLLWRIIGSIATLATLLFIFGFIYAANDVINPKPSDLGSDPQATSGIAEMFPKDDVTIVSLGDSLTKGTGDTAGQGGYVGRAMLKLGELLKKPVHVINEGIDGARADDLLKTLDKVNIQNMIKNADVIMLTIGGNDLNHASDNPIDLEDTNVKATPAPSITPETLPEINYAEIRKSLPATEEKLDKILTKIATLNATAKIVYIALYNPYYIQDTTKEGTAILQDWNLKAAQIANGYPNMVIVPTFDLFQLKIKDYLSVDEFHPNNLGYTRIAERAVQALQ